MQIHLHRHDGRQRFSFAQTGVLTSDVGINTHAVAETELGIIVLDRRIALESLVILLLLIVDICFFKQRSRHYLRILVSLFHSLLIILKSLVIFLEVHIAVAGEQQGICIEHIVI